MSNAVRVLSVLALTGCSDYGLENKPPAATGSTSTPSTATTPQACSTDPLPGFDGSYNDDCFLEASTGSFTPVVKWQAQNLPGPGGSNVMSAPIVVETNDDNGDGVIDTNDTPDVVFVSYGLADGTLRALDGASGTQLWEADGYGLQGQGGVAAGDLDGDGVIELVSLKPNGAVAFENDGTVKWNVEGLAGHIYGTSDVPAIADMKHDGHPVVIAGNAVLDGRNGNLLFAGNLGMGGVNGQNVGTCSFSVDLDGDGQEELITGNTAYNSDGTVKWHVDKPDGYPAVADFDGDGQGEVVVSGQGELRLIDTDGTFLGAVPIPGASSAYYGGPPTVADFDGDGEPEIGVAAGSKYSVIESNGKINWQADTDDSSSGNTGSAVFDFEGDGAAEVVYADQTKLWVFDGRDGSVKLSSDQHSNATWLEYPVIADVDGDGHVEIVTVNNPYLNTQSGIIVFGDRNDSWQPGRKIWNQYAYFITNVNDDGTIPRKSEQNWLHHNNFRSGDLGRPDGLAAPDLRLHADLCETECAQGTLFVHIYAGNEGASDVLVSDHPVVTLYSVSADGKKKQLDQKPVPNDLVAGVYQESIVFELEGYDPTKWASLLAVVSSDAAECDPSNDTLEIKGPFCQ